MILAAVAVALNLAAALWALRATRRAAGAEARLAEVFRQVPGAAAILEAPDGKLLLRSAQSNEVLGHAPIGMSRLGDMTAYGGLHADGRRYATGDYPIMRALKHGETVDGEHIRYIRPDGVGVDLDVHAGPVRDANGHIVAAVGMAFDVTQRMEAERRLRASEAEHRALAERLRAALAARDVLMHEADHRIKNSLQLVTSMLRLQRSRAADMGVRDALGEAIARVDAIANAHLALEQSDDLRTVEVDTMLETLCHRIGVLNPAVVITCRAESAATLDSAQAAPLALIASEVLTNALRHAYPAGAPGKMSVTITQHNGLLSLVIADRGVGLPPQTRRRGLGSTVIEALARQIGATVAIASEPGCGVAVTIGLPAEAKNGPKPAALAIVASG